MINRIVFLANLSPLFPAIRPSQQQGIESVLNEAELRHTDNRWLGYIFATIYHETGRKMQPVKEFGSDQYLKGKPYYPYYGRDLTQTTWLANYQKVKDFSGIDVVSNPDLIADLPLSVKVSFTFMENGWYTGRKLSQYFNDSKTDPIGARRIINGQNCAEMIAGYYNTFFDAIKNSFGISE